MTLIGLIIVLLVIGVALHLIRDKIEPTIYTLILVIIVVIVCLALLAMFGLISVPIRL